MHQHINLFLEIIHEQNNRKRKNNAPLQLTHTPVIITIQGVQWKWNHRNNVANDVGQDHNRRRIQRNFQHQHHRVAWVVSKWAVQLLHRNRKYDAKKQKVNTQQPHVNKAQKKPRIGVRVPVVNEHMLCFGLLHYIVLYCIILYPQKNKTIKSNKIIVHILPQQIPAIYNKYLTY